MHNSHTQRVTSFQVAYCRCRKMVNRPKVLELSGIGSVHLFSASCPHQSLVVHDSTSVAAEEKAS